MTRNQQKRGWSRWERLLFWGGLPLGVVLLIISDDTGGRVLACAMIVLPATAFAWATRAVVRERRHARD